MGENYISEAAARAALLELLHAACPKGCRASENKNLVYKIQVDAFKNLKPADPTQPSRGDYAFQTDLLIEMEDGDIPLVVIELKNNSFTSHDVITYATKARHHKQIYPYLRYGFVVAGLSQLSKRFLTHNEGLDFAMALANFSQPKSLIQLISRQIDVAREMVAYLRAPKGSFTSYEEIVRITQ